MVSQRKNNKPKLIVVLGPTASGKTSLAVLIAKKFNGEIVSADSRQIYKGLDIGTGKATKKEMRGIKHHLLDIENPKKIYDVARYKDLADKAIESILQKGKLPILCGGTGLYIDAVAKNIAYPNVPQNWKLRESLETKSADELFSELKKLDAKRAKTIDKKNKRRLIRAIEIVRLTGKKIDTLKENPKYDVLLLGVKKEPLELEALIFKRLIKRIKQGMIAEAKHLHKKGLSYKRMTELGLEYRYLAMLLEGKIKKNEMINKLNTKIRQYAKRQMTWFKRDKDIHWVASEKEAEKLISEFIGKNTLLA
ncbi:tRNA (adenosine(37)-N6)-dimethylallyltransferase MiaA [Candidatus Azambacteria bacterium]|nr:tRNA (adenosine(37)-N6)-dimethylallyltransferase MiaA [Candidatus Azambacteria bacterium]